MANQLRTVNNWKTDNQRAELGVESFDNDHKAKFRVIFFNFFYSPKIVRLK